MKFYSEVTEEMYDTIEALQTAEEKVSLKAEKEEDINEIFDLVREASELEKKTLKKMADYDQKYGFGSVATDLLKKAGVDNKKFTFSFSPTPSSINRNRTKKKRLPAVAGSLSFILFILRIPLYSLF